MGRRSIPSSMARLSLSGSIEQIIMRALPFIKLPTEDRLESRGTVEIVHGNLEMITLGIMLLFAKCRFMMRLGRAKSPPLYRWVAKQATPKDAAAGKHNLERIMLAGRLGMAATRLRVISRARRSSTVSRASIIAPPEEGPCRRKDRGRAWMAISKCNGDFSVSTAQPCQSVLADVALCHRRLNLLLRPLRVVAIQTDRSG
jgi:hypothetical protein